MSKTAATFEALDDLDAIIDYIRQNNFRSAERMQDLFEACAERLTDHPYMYRAGRVRGTGDRGTLTRHLKSLAGQGLVTPPAGSHGWRATTLALRYLQHSSKPLRKNN